MPGSHTIASGFTTTVGYTITSGDGANYALTVDGEAKGGSSLDGVLADAATPTIVNNNKIIANDAGNFSLDNRPGRKILNFILPHQLVQISRIRPKRGQYRCIHIFIQIAQRIDQIVIDHKSQMRQESLPMPCKCVAKKSPRRPRDAGSTIVKFPRRNVRRQANQIW